MARYHFRFSDSQRSSDFSDGRDLDTVEQAIKEAIRELTFMITSRLPDGDHRTFGVTVSDEAGVALYRATITFDGEQLGQAGPT